MAKKINLLITCLIVANLAIGCKKSAEKKENTETIHEENQKFETLCFENVYPYQDSSGMKDTEELTLFIEDGKVTGVYNWLPAEKDNREGSLSGTIRNNVIKATYRFYQEGKVDSTSIEITFDQNSAIVNGGEPELGLDASLKQIKCH